MAVPDNDLNLEEYFNATIKWAARGFEGMYCINFLSYPREWYISSLGDKSTVPSESQKTAATKANLKPAKHHDQPSKSSDSTSRKDHSTSHKDRDIAADNDNNDEDDNDKGENGEGDDEDNEDDKDDDDEDDESAKAEAALANAPAAKERKERATKEAKEQVECDVRERVKAKVKAMKKAEGKADKKKGGERKCLAEEDVTLPPPAKRGRLTKVTTDKPRHSSQTGKGENPGNYKLADGKYKGR